MSDFSSLIPSLQSIVQEAADVIMDIYTSGFVAERKADDSPVTKADRLADTLIVKALKELTPEISVVSEEGEKPIVPEGQPFWLVDPLDGTRSFVARDGQFTVNIALIEHGVPTLGIIQLPARGDMYWGIKGQGAWRRLADAAEAERIQTREPEIGAGYDIVMSKSYVSPKLDSWLQAYPVRRRVQAGSSLKFCRVAEGVADIYPRLGNTMEWDTGAGQCILEAAGGTMIRLDGHPLRYGKVGYLNGGFIASGRPLVAKEIPTL